MLIGFGLFGPLCSFPGKEARPRAPDLAFHSWGLEWLQEDVNHRSVHLLFHALSAFLGPGSGFWGETYPGREDKLKGRQKLMGKFIWQERSQKGDWPLGWPYRVIWKPTQEAGLGETEGRKVDSRTALALHFHFLLRGSGVLSQPPVSFCSHMGA